MRVRDGFKRPLGPNIVDLWLYKEEKLRWMVVVHARFKSGMSEKEIQASTKKFKGVLGASSSKDHMIQNFMFRDVAIKGCNQAEAQCHTWLMSLCVLPRNKPFFPNTQRLTKPQKEWEYHLIHQAIPPPRDSSRSPGPSHPFSLPLPHSFQRAQIVLQGGITWNTPLVKPSLLSEEPAKGHVAFPRCYLRAISPQFSNFSSSNVTHNCLQLLKYEDFLFFIVIYDSKRRFLGVWGCYSDKISNLKASLWTFGKFWWASLTDNLENNQQMKR